VIKCDEKDVRQVDKHTVSQPVRHTHTEKISHTGRLTEYVLGVIVLGSSGCDDISPHTRSSLHLYLAHLISG
jgi:hypothetical protein